MSTSNLPSSTVAISDDELDQVAWRIERHGLRGSEDALRRTAVRALIAGVSPVLAEVLADPDSPEVARIRAFGLVTLRLGAPLPHSTIQAA